MKVYVIANTVLSLCATLVFAKGPRAEALEPHLVLPLTQELSQTASRCLEKIAAAEIRFCKGESGPQEISRLEVHLRSDYRGEWGVAEDRGQILKEAHRRLSTLCGISTGLTDEAFAAIIGTPLAALGTPQTAESARSILEFSSRYFYGVGLQEGLKEGLRSLPASRCPRDPFIGM